MRSLLKKKNGSDKFEETECDSVAFLCVGGRPGQIALSALIKYLFSEYEFADITTDMQRQLSFLKYLYERSHRLLKREGGRKLSCHKQEKLPSSCIYLLFIEIVSSDPGLTTFLVLLKVVLGAVSHLLILM